MMRALAILALCLACASSQEIEVDFMPAVEGTNQFETARSRMQAMAKNLQEMMGGGDAAMPMKRGQTTRKEIVLPGIQVEMEFQMGPPDEEGAERGMMTPPKPSGFMKMMEKRSRTMMKMMARRIRAMKQGMGERMKRLRQSNHGLPAWMHKMSHGSRLFNMRRVQMAWMKKAIQEQCKEAQDLCPTTRCPKKLVKCLRNSDKVSERCNEFLSKFEDFKAKKRDTKRAFKAARKECRRNEDDPWDRHQCIKQARAEKHRAMKEHSKTFRDTVTSSSEMEVHVAQDDSVIDGAESEFKNRMEGLASMVKGLVGKAGEKAEDLKSKAKELGSAATEKATELEQTAAEKVTELKEKLFPTSTKATNGCSKDDDCKTGGDMGGYCKANGDCHCTAPFFGSNGSTCKLTCTPTSKPTACCRDDADCQVGGDKAAYCKSPKSSLHTTPGNGMCRCGTGFTGTTSCHKATKTDETDEADETDEPEEPEAPANMDEGTPAFLTGDIEEPHGEKDMGGWTMRTYTAEQQTRLGVNEVGEPVPIVKSTKAEPKEGSSMNTEQFPWLVMLAVAAIGSLLIFAGLIRRYRAVQQSVELRAVYGEAMSSPAVTTVKGSVDQL